MKNFKLLALACISVTMVGCNSGNTSKAAGQPKRPECIAPAKPGGGFDMTCKLIQSGFKQTEQLKEPIRVTYMPGGVGAVAYNKIVNNDPANNDAVIAFSTGSLLNLAQGKFEGTDIPVETPTPFDTSVFSKDRFAVSRQCPVPEQHTISLSGVSVNFSFDMTPLFYCPYQYVLHLL